MALRVTEAELAYRGPEQIEADRIRIAASILAIADRQAKTSAVPSTPVV